MKDLLARLARWLNGLSPTRAYTLSLFCAVAFALADLCSAPGLSFSLCYVLVIGFAGWTSGALAATLLALIPAAVMAWEDWHVFGNDAPTTMTWNILSRVALYILVSWVCAALARANRRHRAAAQERTAAWKAEAAQHQATTAQLRETVERFEQVINNITEVFWLTNPEKTEMIYISPGYERIWGRSCEALRANPISWLDALHPDDRAEITRRSKTEQTTSAYDVEYRIIRPDATERWIRDRAFPVRNAAGEIYRVAGIAEDMTERVRLERQILEVTDREQARIGQDIHDGLCQELVGIAFDASQLQNALEARGVPDAARAKRMATELDGAITKARQVARGLFPIRMEGEGVISALEELLNSVHERWNFECNLELSGEVQIPPGGVATHLYRIAHEAVNNAVKHSSGKKLVIRLAGIDGTVTLDIEDDGKGFSPSRQDGDGGMGLSIMEYRARTIGASLEIKPRPDGGTIVSCRL
jgi:PAS domain S-box-containing protein